MDWSKVRFPKDFATKRLQAGELSTLDHAKILVHSSLTRRSVSEVVKTAIFTFIRRNWEDSMMERLRAEASRQEIEPEELFSQILNGEIEI